MTSFLTVPREKNVSPFSLLRVAGPFGPMMVSRYSARRFSNFDQEQRYELHDYLWHVLAEKGSGEFGITHLLAPGAFARFPLCDRMNGLKMPVSFVYGSTDWMDASGGLVACENMRKAGNDSVGTYVVSGAGHHVYLDNPFKGWVSWLATQLGAPLPSNQSKEWYEIGQQEKKVGGEKAPHRQESTHSASVRLMNGRDRNKKRESGSRAAEYRPPSV